MLYAPRTTRASSAAASMQSSQRDRTSGSASRWLRVPTQALRRQVRAEYEAAAALCRKMGMRRSCKHLREVWKPTSEITKKPNV